MALIFLVKYDLLGNKNRVLCVGIVAKRCLENREEGRSCILISWIKQNTTMKALKQTDCSGIFSSIFCPVERQHLVILHSLYTEFYKIILLLLEGVQGITALANF